MAALEAGALVSPDVLAGANVGADTGTDVCADMGAVVGADVGVDVGANAGADVGADVRADTGADGRADTGDDVGADTGVDVGANTGDDVVADAGMGTVVGSGPLASTSVTSFKLPSGQVVQDDGAVATVGTMPFTFANCAARFSAPPGAGATSPGKRSPPLHGSVGLHIAFLPDFRVYKPQWTSSCRKRNAIPPETCCETACDGFHSCPETSSHGRSWPG